MKKLFLLTIAIIFCLSVALAQEKEKVDLEKLAVSLVNECAAIQKDEIVLINGSVRDLELLENIAVNVRKVGAFPMITVSSDRMSKRMFIDVPEKYDAQMSLLDKNLVGFITAQISVSSGESTDLFADIPPERFAKRAEANKPLVEMYEKRVIKGVNLGNGLYPTKALADEFEISIEKLDEIFWKGIEVDYNKLYQIGEKLQNQLSNADELQITHKNGTNFSVKISNCQSIISDGVISQQDLKKGVAGRNVFLPAGEVYFAPVENTANGKLIFDHQTFMGTTIKNLELEFKDGKLVSMKAESGLEKLKSY